MAIAIAALSVGAWFIYSALKGTSLSSVFTDVGSSSGTKEDPAGTLPSAPDAQLPAAPGGTPLFTGQSNLVNMTGEMNRMIGLGQPYKYGGGHPHLDSNGPWDCSGAVSWLLHFMGMLAGPNAKTSTQLMVWGEAGKGKAFTVYTNPGHVFIIMETGQYAGKAWGTTSRSARQGGSIKWHDHTTVGFVARHYKGW